MAPSQSEPLPLQKDLRLFPSNRGDLKGFVNFYDGNL